MQLPCFKANQKRDMMSKELLITLADVEVAFRFHFSGTGMLFRNYDKKGIPDDYGGAMLSAEQAEIRTYAEETGCSMEFAEYNCLMKEAANYLTEIDRVMFHGVAFLYGTGAYILTAPSGTGKSTQFRNLRQLYGERIQIINGDKPLLGPGQNGEIIVYPSPWNGKENWAGREYGPLRAVFLLEQSQNNKLKPLDRRDAVVPILKQFLYTAPTRKSVHTVFRMADALVREVPLYQLLNKGNLASSEMLFECIRKVEDAWQ